MTLQLAAHTLRECHRRPFPYVVAIAVSLLGLASHLFQAFSFGAGELEATNLALSAVFLAGLVHAAFLGTALIRVDIERGTLGLLLSKPVGLGSYLAGRYLGLAASSCVLCLAVAAAMALVFALPLSPVSGEILGAALLLGWARALLPVLVLDAAALAASAIAPRVFAPVALIGVFVAGSIAGRSGFGLLLPDFGVFGLEAGATPPLGILALYTIVYGVVFLLCAYLVLDARPPLRTHG